MAHGGGGRLMHDLIEGVFVRAFGPSESGEMHDAAELHTGSHSRLAFTTDSYVVRPLFFAGGSIGELAVYGTVNDLAMGGADPVWLSAAFILEEGLELEVLLRVVEAMRDAAVKAGVRIVTGDTKVVERGKCDSVYIATAGVGRAAFPNHIGPLEVRENDAVIVSGDLARHGIAVMAAREGFEFETSIESDCAPLAEPVLALAREGVDVHCLRDLTRGGLASALVEIAEAGRCTIALDDSAIPVSPDVLSACEILGFDPMQVANEGRFVAFVPASDANQALAILRRHPVTAGAVQIGTVRSMNDGVVLLKTLGGERPVDMLSGELLPRIC
jgi:hydrogenase expression/formation protein HypE